MHVYIGAAVLFVLIAAPIIFLLLKPTYEEIKQKQQKLEEETQVANRRPQAEQKLEQLQEEKEQLEVDYEAIRSRKMRGFDLDLSEPSDVALLALWKEQRDRFGPHLTEFIESTGVQLDPFSLPAPMKTLPQTEPGGILRMPPGGTLSLKVTGSYDQLLRFLRSWERFDRLVAIGQISIQRVAYDHKSTTLAMSFPLTVYTFPKGVEAAAPAPAAPAGPGMEMGMPMMGMEAGGMPGAMGMEGMGETMGEEMGGMEGVGME